MEGDLITWFPAPSDTAAFVASVRSSLEGRVGDVVPIEWDWRPDQDWLHEWRAGLGPRRVGRIVVTPTWCEPELDPGEVAVVIDPQMAFGTGEHASTRGALRLLQQFVRSGDTALDLGTGSGLLAIAAALLGAGSVLAVDNDGNALVNARGNVLQNGCAASIILDEVTVDATWLGSVEICDLVLANILSGVLVPLLPAMREALRPGGRAILAGMLSEEAADVRAAIPGAGFRELESDVEDGWWSVALEAIS